VLDNCGYWASRQVLYFLVWDFVLRSSETGLALSLSGASVGLGVTTSSTGLSEMTAGFSFPRSSEHEGASSWGAFHDELIEGDARATGGGDASAGGFSESHSGNIDFGHVEDSLVISDGSDNDGDFLAVFDVSDNSGHGYRGSGSAGSLQSSEDGLGESGLTSSGEEGEELTKEC
jgi:hypothetical protein